MTTAKKAAAKKATREVSTPEPEPVLERRCNVPDCPKEPGDSGLCGGHYATHRGLADAR